MLNLEFKFQCDAKYLVVKYTDGQINLSLGLFYAYCSKTVSKKSSFGEASFSYTYESDTSCVSNEAACWYVKLGSNDVPAQS
jgi:hypothetical protein